VSDRDTSITSVDIYNSIVMGFSVIAWQTILLVVKIQLPYYYDGRICIWSKIDSNKNDVLKATSGGGFI
jgi:hypothetical protein